MRSDRTRKDTAKHYAVVLAFLLFCSIIFYVQAHYQHTSASRPEDDYQGRIPQFHSSADRDDDGVDDQLDILNGALAYVSTHPKYKSRYYETGYPDDGYGVCTDVVAYALKNAGYDLQELVDADIRRLWRATAPVRRTLRAVSRRISRAIWRAKAPASRHFTSCAA